MMVRSDSWHFRVWKLTHSGDTDRPKNLCLYFWRIFFTITIPLVICGFALVGVGFALYGLIIAFWQHTGISLAVVGGIAILALAILAAVWYEPRWRGGRYARYEAARLKRLQEKENPPQPSIIWEFLKAKKQRVCPMITVEYPEDELAKRPWLKN